MKNRPLSVTLVSFLFIGAGIAGIIYHFEDFKKIPEQPEEIWILLLRVIAIVGGALTLVGNNLARWILIAWMIVHVVLSIFHSTEELIMHLILTVVIAFALFNPKANAYFRKK